MIEKYFNEMIINGMKPYTVTYQTSILKNCNDFKPLDQWSKDTVNAYLTYAAKTNKRSTIEVKKTILKKFFTWSGKSDIVSHLKIKHTETALKRDDILTTEDINKMIDATNSPMYKALIAFLFESGGRIHEVLPVKFEDIKETDKGMIIRIHATKTGDEYRSILCVFSASYIRNLISYSGLVKGNLLFSSKRSAVYQMFRYIAKKAGVQKKVNPHALRHAQAVNMLELGYQDIITKKKLGWKDDSKMLARYSHCIDDDVINATLEKAGNDVPKAPIINIQQPIETLKPIDISMQMQKMNTENIELKEKMEAMEKMINSIADKLGDSPRELGMHKKWTLKN